MPQLTADELQDRAKDFGRLLKRRRKIEEAFAKKKKEHDATVKKLTADIEAIVVEITDEYAEDVQTPLPVVAVGSGPDAPTVLDELRDPDPGDVDCTTEYEQGAEAFRRGDGGERNPYTGVGELEARRRAAWNSGWEDALEANAEPTDEDAGQ